MIEFHRIENTDNPYFTHLYDLYTGVFPKYERRSWAGLDMELNKEKQFCANALIENHEFIGLFNYWVFEKFYYIEHLALAPKFRGKRKGTIALEIFKELASIPIVLEVEMPNNSEAIRRIKFYEKSEYKVISHYYAQPPYEGDGFLIPMIIMSNDIHFTNTHFEQIKDTLYKKVYRFIEPNDRGLDD
ncbi:MAG: GNAT family N-acetyltransferase [Paludibacter sp.]|nr:GNAT family N-acetyltransferase [Paludibacter sp.]